MCHLGFQTGDLVSKLWSFSTDMTKDTREIPAPELMLSVPFGPLGSGLGGCCLEGTWLLGQDSHSVPGRALLQGDGSTVQGRALGCG